MMIERNTTEKQEEYIEEFTEIIKIKKSKQMFHDEDIYLSLNSIFVELFHLKNSNKINNMNLFIQS